MKPRDVLKKHQQLYSNSCAASAMELILKLHSLVPDDFRKLQDKYCTELPIGFSKLADLQPYGICAANEKLPFDGAMHIIECEVDHGRFPLVAMLNQPQEYHIWVAVRENGAIHLLSRAYGNPKVIQVPCIETVRNRLLQGRSGRVDFVTYKLDNDEHA